MIAALGIAIVLSGEASGLAHGVGYSTIHALYMLA